MNYILDNKNTFYSKGFIKKEFSGLEKTLEEINLFLKKEIKIKNEKEYSSFIKPLLSIIYKNKNTISSPLHDKELKALKTPYPLYEKTPWGGVSIKEADTVKNFIKKLLIINKLGVLGFETHKSKQENLRVLEGACLVIYSMKKDKKQEKGKICVELALPNSKFSFMPKDDHGIIAITNCVIEETSTNNLDDLIYIYKIS